MNPSAVDADGILNGRRAAEGKKIGMVSNYLDFPNGTSYHLHFDESRAADRFATGKQPNSIEPFCRH
jgi:hypothetical protein